MSQLCCFTHDLLQPRLVFKSLKVLCGPVEAQIQPEPDPDVLLSQDHNITHGPPIHFVFPAQVHGQLVFSG